MNICFKCKIELNENNSYTRKRVGGGLQPYCKNCLHIIQKERWLQRKFDAIKYKGGKCQRCGYDKFYGALEFHHRDPSTKLYDWSKLKLRTWECIKIELDKCDLLCSNCHREIHNEL